MCYEAGKTEAINSLPISVALKQTKPFYWSFNCLVIDSKREVKRLRMKLLNDRSVSLLEKQPSLKTLSDVKKLATEFNVDAVVNCMGLGSGEVFGDQSVIPAKGIVVMYNRPDSMKMCANYLPGSNDSRPVYVIPRGDIVVAGGTFYKGDSTTEATGEDVNRIKNNVQNLHPGLIETEIAGTWVGHRPYREDGIRFETQTINNIPLLHNYGHGGSGWTLFYGAAKATVNQLTTLLQK